MPGDDAAQVGAAGGQAGREVGEQRRVLRGRRPCAGGLHAHAHPGQDRAQSVVQVSEDPLPLGVALAGHVAPGVLGLDGQADRPRDQGDGGQQLRDDLLLAGLGPLRVAGLDRKVPTRSPPTSSGWTVQRSGTAGASSPRMIRASRAAARGGHHPGRLVQQVARLGPGMQVGGDQRRRRPGRSGRCRSGARAAPRRTQRAAGAAIAAVTSAVNAAEVFAEASVGPARAPSAASSAVSAAAATHPAPAAGRGDVRPADGSPRPSLESYDGHSGQREDRERDCVAKVGGEHQPGPDERPHRHARGRP